MRLLLLFAFSHILAAADPISLLPGDGLSAFTFHSVGQTGRREAIEVAGQPFTTAMRIRVAHKPELAYAVNLLGSIPQAIAAGDTLELDLWLRGEPGEGQSEAAVSVLHQLSEKPWTSLASRRLLVTTDWTRHRFAYRAERDYDAGTSRIAIFFGLVGPQVVEVAAPACRNHGGSVTPESLGIVVAAPVKAR